MNITHPTAARGAVSIRSLSKSFDINGRKLDVLLGLVTRAGV